MFIIIDGYNLLRQEVGTQRLYQAELTAFIALLSRYARHKGHRVLVVFDGGPYERPTRIHERGIEIIYAGRRVSADEVIAGLLEEKLQKECLVVSSDRAVVDHARAQGCVPIDSDAFYILLMQDRKRPQSRKQAQDRVKKFDAAGEWSAFDQLMTEGSKVMPPQKDEGDFQVRQSRRQTTSAIDKKLMALIKKL